MHDEIRDAFAALPYPLTKDEAIEALGDLPLPSRAGAVPLGRVLDGAPELRFDGMQDAVSALERRWRLLDAEDE